mmetsp:Transcript_27804/g.90980  ORF Transcript_27804/g.90980 Transcript_27804/m.90980 type:complete len:216 (+) Transcript_27804:571-1218(+)
MAGSAASSTRRPARTMYVESVDHLLHSREDLLHATAVADIKLVVGVHRELRHVEDVRSGDGNARSSCGRNNRRRRDAATASRRTGATLTKRRAARWDFDGAAPLLERRRVHRAAVVHDVKALRGGGRRSGGGGGLHKNLVAVRKQTPRRQLVARDGGGAGRTGKARNLAAEGVHRRSDCARSAGTGLRKGRFEGEGRGDYGCCTRGIPRLSASAH